MSVKRGACVTHTGCSCWLCECWLGKLDMMQRSETQGPRLADVVCDALKGCGDVWGHQCAMVWGAGVRERGWAAKLGGDSWRSGRCGERDQPILSS